MNTKSRKPIVKSQSVPPIGDLDIESSSKDDDSNLFVGWGSSIKNRLDTAGSFVVKCIPPIIGVGLAALFVFYVALKPIESLADEVEPANTVTVVETVNDDAGNAVTSTKTVEYDENGKIKSVKMETDQGIAWISWTSIKDAASKLRWFAHDTTDAEATVVVEEAQPSDSEGDASGN